jgi:hypothetical protein
MILTRCLILLVGLISGLAPLFGQAGCDTYFPMRAGVAWEMIHYGDAGTRTGFSRTELTAKEAVAGQTVLLATTTSRHEPQNEEHTISYDMTCLGTGVGIDMRSSLGYISSSPGIKTHFESSNLVYPNNMSVGMTLPSAKLILRIVVGNVEQSRHTRVIRNRQVTGQEIKSVTAGTFECLVIEEDHDLIDGQNKLRSHIKIWLSPGNGIIATESFDKGKRTGYSELSALQR